MITHEQEEAEHEIVIELDTPNGPRVEYGDEHGAGEVMAELPKGWEVDWSNTVKIRPGVYRSPLVRCDVAPVNPMVLLCRSFPTLVGAPCTDPFDPATLDDWACGPEPGGGARCAVRFVLAIWSGRVGHVSALKTSARAGGHDWLVTTGWRSGLFDVVRALNVWELGPPGRLPRVGTQALHHRVGSTTMGAIAGLGLFIVLLFWPLWVADRLRDLLPPANE